MNIIEAIYSTFSAYESIKYETKIQIVQHKRNYDFFCDEI